jgi:hypothetical protein
MKIYLSILFICIIVIVSSCSGDSNDNNARMESDLSRLVSWMTGSFSSQEQSQKDSSYFDIRLEMVPIWHQRSDAHWLYIEQAAATSLDRPYRQRVYRLTQIDDSTFQSRVYTFNDPSRFVGAWKGEIPLHDFSPDSLIERYGCDIILHKDGDTAFIGSTVGKNCSSDLRGAAYATSEVRITADMLFSWDRGFDASDNQVWGAQKGGYVFRKLDNLR